MNLGTFKGKKVAAQKGYDLLKSKADALKVCQRANDFLGCIPDVESVAVLA
jgi:vacuolar-type H+-ATPase subunit D/Vma8